MATGRDEARAAHMNTRKQTRCKVYPYHCMSVLASKIIKSNYVVKGAPT